MKIIHRVKGFLQGIHPKSILLRIMLAVIAGIFLVVSISASAFYRYEYSAAHEANCALMQSSVESISQSYALVLSNNLAQKLYDLSHNSTIRSILYYTEPLDTDITAVLTNLNTITTNNIYISSILFYDARHDIVLDSKYNRGTSKGIYRNLINYYYELPESSTAIEYNHELCDFFSYENEFYLATRFAGQINQSYGTFIIKINIHYLYRMVFQQNSNNFNFFVYDKDGTPVFPNEIDYSSIYLSDSELSNLLAQEQSYIDQNGFTYFCYTSSATNWKFIAQTETRFLKPQAESIFKLFAPIFVLVNFIAFLLSLVIIYVIYAPLKRTYDSILNLLPDNAARPKNELGYITYAFSEMDATMKQMETLMEDISEDILNRIFTDMLNNVTPRYEYVKTSIQSIRSPFKFDSIYVASAIQFPEECVIGEESDEDSTLHRINSALSAFNARTESTSFVKSMGNGMVAVITSFAPTADIDKAHQTLDNMEVLLTGLLQQMGISVLYARGHFYHSILDITASYNRALSVIAKRRRTTLVSTQTVVNSAPELKSSVPESRNLSPEFRNNDALNYQIDLILNSVSTKKAAEAYPILQDILTDLKQRKPFGNSELQSLCTFVKDFSDMLESKSLIKETDVIHSGLLIAKCRAVQPQDEQSLCAEMEQFCTTLLDNAQEQFKVIQNPYLLKAKKYIESHYSDASLSLEIIAAECDITPNYLSKLFATSGTYYSEYISQYRITKSITLLRETDLSVNEIAERCGFNSPQSYIRVFKKQLGLTPGSFRK